MEVGAYTLDLYCDHPRHSELHPNKFHSLDAQFVGETYSNCKAQAKKRGWKWENDQVICKVCNNSEGK